VLAASLFFMNDPSALTACKAIRYFFHTSSFRNDYLSGVYAAPVSLRRCARHTAGTQPTTVALSLRKEYCPFLVFYDLADKSRGLLWLILVPTLTSFGVLILLGPRTLSRGELGEGERERECNQPRPGRIPSSHHPQ
jgi:hypothetical protein